MIRIHLINVINLFIYMFIGPVMIFVIFEFKKVSTWPYIMNLISYLMTHGKIRVRISSHYPMLFVKIE